MRSVSSGRAPTLVGAAICLSCALLLAAPTAAMGHAPPPAKPAPAPSGLSLRAADGRYSMRVQPLVQMRHQYLTVAGAEDTNSFRLKHAQLRFSGHVVVPEVRYKIMISMPGTEGGANVDLRDAWVDLRFSKNVQLKVGQFILYDHENLEPTWALQMVDRSIVYYEFGLERELGVDLHGRLFGDRLEYNLFLINGYGRNQLSKNSALSPGARLAFNILGRHDYMVADLNSSEQPHLAVGMAAFWHPRHADLKGNGLWHPTADLAFRWRGFSALAVGYSVVNTDLDATDLGAVAQLGCFLLPGRLESAFRYGRVMNDGARGKNGGPQVGAVALSWFVHGHSLQVQTEYAVLTPTGDLEGFEHRVTTQLQVFLK